MADHLARYPSSIIDVDPQTDGTRTLGCNGWVPSALRSGKLRDVRTMPGLGHRVLVYFGLKEDLELSARWEDEPVDRAVLIAAWAIPVLLLVVAVVGGLVYAFVHSRLLQALGAIASLLMLMGVVSELWSAARRRRR